MITPAPAETTSPAQVLNPIEAAMALARQQAAEAQAAASAGVVATANQPTGTDVGFVKNTEVGFSTAPMPQAGERVTLDDLMSGMIAVDGWLKVTPDGLKVGDNAKIVDEFNVIIDMTEGVGYIGQRTIKFGDPVRYVKTYDKVLNEHTKTSTGANWMAELARIAQISPKATPYPSADLCMMLDKDTGTMKEGELVGYALSTTNFKHFAKLRNEVKAAGLDGVRCLVKLTHKALSKDGRNWGEMKFTLIGPADTDE